MGRLLPSLQDALARQSASPAASSASTSAPSTSARPTPDRPPTMATAAPATTPDEEGIDGDYSDLPPLIVDPLTQVFALPLGNFRGRAPRPPSAPPSPPQRDQPTSGWEWDPTAPVGWGGPLPHWRYDAHPDHSGWNASAQGHGAALMLNAAYDAEGAPDVTLPPLDMRWHRPDDRELSPFGNNQRGDIAPHIVHAALDDVLAPHPTTPLEVQLFHCWIDSTWFRHSRSQARCVEAVRRLDYFNEEEVVILVAALVAEPLTDFRAVMHTVDPRPRPVYGRTQDSDGQSRLFRMFPLTLERADRATWDEDDGNLSGSSREGPDATPPFTLTVQQQVERRRRHLERRARHALPAIEAAERTMEDVEGRLRHAQRNLGSARTLGDILLRGMNAPAGSEERERIWLGWS